MAARQSYNPLSDALAPYTNPPPLQPFELELFTETEPLLEEERDIEAENSDNSQDALDSNEEPHPEDQA